MDSVQQAEEQVGMQPNWQGALPRDIFTTLALFCDDSSVAAARRSCSTWRGYIDASIRQLEPRCWPQEPEFFNKFPVLISMRLVRLSLHEHSERRLNDLLLALAESHPALKQLSLGAVGAGCLANVHMLGQLTSLELVSMKAPGDSPLLKLPSNVTTLTALRELTVHDAVPDNGKLPQLVGLERLRLRGTVRRRLPVDLLKSIQGLTQLKSLDVSGLRGANGVPTALSGMLELRELDISNSMLTRLPAEIGLMQELTRLDVSRCMLHTLPDELGQLSALQVLNACGNDGLVLPLTMTQLTCLRVLDLSQTCANVGELLAAGTTRFSALEELRLAFNGITSLPPALRHMAGLRSLVLSNNDLEHLPAELGALTALTELQVSANRLAALPYELGMLLQLEMLDASSNMLRQLPASMAHLGRLRALDLTNNLLTELPTWMAKLTSMRELRVGFNAICTLPDLAVLGAGWGEHLRVLELGLDRAHQGTQQVQALQQALPHVHIVAMF